MINIKDVTIVMATYNEEKTLEIKNSIIEFLGHAKTPNFNLYKLPVN